MSIVDQCYRRQGSLWGWERKLFESHCESPSRLRPCSALLASGKLPRRKIFEERKKVTAFVDTEQAGQSRYRQPVQGVGQHWHRGQHSSTIEPRNTRQKKGLKILIICFLKYLISSASSDSCCCFWSLVLISYIAQQVDLIKVKLIRGYKTTS